jgi:hypothetical protein
MLNPDDAEGVHVGRPRSLPEDVRARIAADRAAGSRSIGLRRL